VVMQVSPWVVQREQRLLKRKTRRVSGGVFRIFQALSVLVPFCARNPCQPCNTMYSLACNTPHLLVLWGNFQLLPEFGDYGLVCVGEVAHSFIVVARHFGSSS
jgi:hypothetical protein